MEGTELRRRNALDAAPPADSGGRRTASGPRAAARVGALRRAAARRLVARMVAVAIAVAASPDPAEAQGQADGSIVGVIASGESARPLHAAVVRVQALDRIAVTDRDGAFHIADVPPGLYQVRVEHIGYRTRTQAVRVSAGEAATLRLELEPAPVTLEELVVTATLGARALSAALRPTAAVAGRELERRLNGTVAATLREEPGLAVRSMGPAPARPVIRGLGGDRILILEDGERVGDVSSTSADHAVAIDPLSARRIEVVRGPAALFYGSNALGGVVNVVRDEIPHERPERPLWDVALQGQTASPGVAGSGSFTQPVGPLAIRLEGTGRTAGDLRTPAGVTPNTDLLSYNGALAASWIGERGHVGAGLRHFRSDYGIPPDPIAGHPGGVDVELRRTSGRAEALWRRELGPFSEFTATGSWTDYHHQEIEGTGAVGTEFGLITHAAELQATNGTWGPFARGGFGVRVQEVRFGADAGRGVIRADELSGGLFALQELELGRWELQGGVRYDVQRSTPLGVGSIRGIPAARRTFQSLSVSVAALHEVADGVRVGVSGARAFRTPSPEELFSQGPHLAAYTFEVGNPELEAETGYGLDLLLRIDRPGLRAELTGFWNEIDGFIYPENTGETRGNLFVYRHANAEARFTGGELGVEWHLTERLALDATASHVRATNRSVGEPLPFIPPFHGHVDLRFEPERWYTVLGWRWTLAQERLPSPPDLPFGRTYCQGPEPAQNCVPVPGEFRRTAGHALLDASAGYRWEMGGRTHSVSLRMENVTNAEYRNHLSWIKELAPEPGRNLSLVYRVGM